MDANTIRIILFILGIIVIAGIYLFDRSRKRGAPTQAVSQRREPTGLGDENSDDILLGEVDSPAFHEPPRAQSVGDASMAKTPVTQEAEPEAAIPVRDQVTRDLDIAVDDNDEDIDEAQLLAAENPDLPTLIVQIHVIAHDGEFPGEAVFAAVWDVGLEHGDMGIFHRYQNTPHGRKTLFSMANLVEPGTFDPENPGFTTPGLALFTQLPVAKDGLAVFSDMLFTAECLAAALDGELYDESHSAMSRQTIAHIRERILEHRRRVQLAMS